MPTRRQLLKSSLIAGVSLTRLPIPQISAADIITPGFELTHDAPTRLFDGERCWCHPRAGIVPGAGQNGLPRVVMTMNTLHLDGSDVFKAVYGLTTDDLGQTWTGPAELDPLAVRTETIDGVERPVAVSDFWPTWHEASATLLGTGHTVVYTPDWRVTHPRPRQTSYAVYDADHDRWQPWRKLPMPVDEDYHDAGAGCTQRVDLEDGRILLPFYFRPPGVNSRVAVARCEFDGEDLRFLEHGNVLSIDDNTRGLHEPSLARVGDGYFLTIRNDRTAFVTRSDDGLNFEPLREWTFDDGNILGSYNTQAHWVTRGDALFLVYTRRGADNDHVFRHRAPLFMAQVDTRHLQVIRHTEQVLVPERGARLGNFGVTDVTEDETWVTVAEWMQPRGVEQHGSDGSVWVARIRWN